MMNNKGNNKHISRVIQSSRRVLQRNADMASQCVILLTPFTLESECSDFITQTLSSSDSTGSSAMLYQCGLRHAPPSPRLTLPRLWQEEIACLSDADTKMSSDSVIFTSLMK